MPRDHDRFHVVAYDFGVNRIFVRLMADRGCRISTVPAQTTAKDVLKLKPDGVFLANGPGDPEPCDYAVEATREFIARKVPTFGICLGHQILGLAVGARTLKMKFGHHGANHPVLDLASRKVYITSQNHGFAVDEKTLPQMRASRTCRCSMGHCKVRLKMRGVLFQAILKRAPVRRYSRPVRRFVEMMTARRLQPRATENVSA